MKRSVNKSALIREIYTKNPNLKASEIVAQLKKDGVAVSAPLVYQTLSKAGTVKAAPKKRGRKPSKGVVVAAAKGPSAELFAAMQAFVSAAGSLDKAIAILNVFK
jgi:arginine repressor